MNYKKYCLVLFILLAQNLPAQKVRLDLPAFADKPIVLMLKQGINYDTVYSGKLNATGRAEIGIPAAASGYAGMARITIENNLFEFILNSENVEIQCSDKYLHGENVRFGNSPENTALQSWFGQQARRKVKLDALINLLNIYSQNEAFYSPVKKEYDLLAQQQADFETLLTKSPLYAARFMYFHNFMEQRIAPLILADSLQKAAVRQYVLDSLDIESLYTSGLWFEVLNGLLAIYEKNSPRHELFIKDMSQLLARITKPRIYTHLVENLFAICESVGWSDLEEQLAYFVLNNDRLKELTPRLKQLITTMKLVKGGVAPALIQHTLYPKTILAFHESGCGHCENEMNLLANNYSRLKDNGFEVISVSSDVDTIVFRNGSRLFPWTDKYCDFQGFAGLNFKIYGIIGTPTFFVIEKGLVKSRCARLEDCLLEL